MQFMREPYCTLPLQHIPPNPMADEPVEDSTFYLQFLIVQVSSHLIPFVLRPHMAVRTGREYSVSSAKGDL
jgi:hypothetical protein